MSFERYNRCAMPAVALVGVIVLNTTHGGNEIILLDRAIYRRKPFDMWSSLVYAALLEARNPWGRPRGVVSAHQPLSFLAMALSMAQRTPVLTAEACMYGLSSTVKRRKRGGILRKQIDSKAFGIRVRASAGGGADSCLVH
jgi:hypothetical protein